MSAFKLTDLARSRANHDTATRDPTPRHRNGFTIDQYRGDTGGNGSGVGRMFGLTVRRQRIALTSHGFAI